MLLAGDRFALVTRGSTLRCQQATACARLEERIPMTENYPAPPAPRPSAPLPPSGDDQHGTADVVKDKAADLGQSGVDVGKHAAGVAQEQAAQVAAEATRQGRDLLRQAQGQLGEQAARGQQRLATELLSLGDELSSMADGSQQHGAAADLVRQAAPRAWRAGQWLDDRSPTQVFDDVQAFARRRPGVFLAAAVGAGLAAGRLTRGLTASKGPDDDPGASAALPARPSPVVPARPEPRTGAGYPVVTAEEITQGTLGRPRADSEDTR
jgi:hypothetical protein